ncbi:hypothetical protein GC207_03110 [bacterium]|nr:hypothetical protein [bacterium]
MKTGRGKWIILFALSCSTGFFAWRYYLAERQFAAASFVHHQIETTQKSYIDGVSDVRSLAMRLNFLRGYYEHEMQFVTHPVLRESLERNYRQTLTNAMVVLRGLTNDLGNDPDAWIDRYGK